MKPREIKLFILIMDDAGQVGIQPICDEEKPEDGFESLFAGIGLQALLRKEKMKKYPSIRAAFNQRLVPEARKLKKGWKDSLLTFFNRIRNLQGAIREAWKG